MPPSSDQRPRKLVYREVAFFAPPRSKTFKTHFQSLTILWGIFGRLRFPRLKGFWFPFTSTDCEGSLILRLGGKDKNIGSRITQVGHRPCRSLQKEGRWTKSYKSLRIPRLIKGSPDKYLCISCQLANHGQWLFIGCQTFQLLSQKCVDFSDFQEISRFIEMICIIRRF